MSAGGRASSVPPSGAAVSSGQIGLPVEGEVIGRKYRLETRIAKGGMSSVWIAHNEPLDVRVAVKFIRADLAGPKAGRLADRLLIEARATARLGHPAIVRVSDFGKTDRGIPFLVMELLEGESLDRALARRGRVSARKAVQALLPIAHAIVSAHDQGIIHRDLKPENIFLAQQADGRIQPKLIDFGISRHARQGAKRLTFAGEAVGTPAYMCPEQISGEDADHRADIWSFGVMLYELVTGRLPFERNTLTATAWAIMDDPPPPIASFSAGDDHLWAIISRGLAKDPERRWGSMRELGVELACWLIDRGVGEDITGASLESKWLSSPTDSAHPDAFVSLVPRPPQRSAAPTPVRGAPPQSPASAPGEKVRDAPEPSPSPRAAYGQVSVRPADKALAKRRAAETLDSSSSLLIPEGAQPGENLEVSDLSEELEAVEPGKPTPEAETAPAPPPAPLVGAPPLSPVSPRPALSNRLLTLVLLAAVLLLALGVVLGWQLGR